MDGTAIVPVWVSPLLAAIIVAMASGFAWSAARPVLRDPAGSALPERLQVWRGQQQFAAAVAIAVLAFSGRHAFWSIPVVWLALQLIVHRVRRRAYGDTWTFGGQLSWTLRAYLGSIAFWWAAALAPLALLAFEASAVAVVATGLVLAAWNHFYGDILLTLLDATPLTRPELEPVFERVLARARVPRPRLMRAGPPGAQLANAFAFSHPRGDVVLFLDALLEHATPTEAAGVLAHEVGHLEDFATKRGSLYAHGALLAAGAATVTLVARAAMDVGVAQVAVVVWVGVVFGSLIVRARNNQQRERDSDRRAVELCGGDGEALVGALVLLHTLGIVPRRLARNLERQATHPSLARRIRAVRTAAGVPPDLLEPRAIRAAEPTRAVVFERERLALVVAPGPADVSTTGSALAHAVDVTDLPYARITELRLEPSRQTDGAILVVGTDAGREHRLRFEKADLPALQAMLDLADQRMATDTAAPAAARGRQWIDRVTGALAAATLLAAGVWPLALAALTAAIRPTTALLAAVAAGALASTLLPGTTVTHTATMALILVGVVAAAAALRHAQTQPPGASPASRAWVIVQVVATAFGALWPTTWIAILGRTDLAALHVAARAGVPAAAGWAALGVLLVMLAGRVARIAGVVCLAIAAATLGLASTAFRDRYAPDPLIATSAPPLTIDDLPGGPVARLTLAGIYRSVALAPDARHVLLRGQMRGGAPFIVAGWDGWQRTIDAQDAALVDGATILVARVDGTAHVLAAESIRGGAVRWTLRIPDAPDGPLEVDPAGRWRLSTDARDDLDEIDPDVGSALAAATVVEGRIGEATFTRRPKPRLLARRFTAPAHLAAWPIHELTWRTDIAAGHKTLVRGSRLAIECLGPSLSSPVAACLAATADETFVWTVDQERGAVRPVARRRGRFLVEAGPDSAGLVWHDYQLLLLRPGSPRALRISRDVSPYPHTAVARGAHVATLTTSRTTSAIALYKVE